MGETYAICDLDTYGSVRSTSTVTCAQLPYQYDSICIDRIPISSREVALGWSSRVRRGCGFAFTVLFGGLALGWLATGIWPYPSERIVDDPGMTWRVLDRDGVVLREAVGPWRVMARWTPLQEISPQVVQGLIAVEDRRFYRHPGVDFLGGARAIAQRLWYGRAVSGASTLTMQLARLLGGFERDGGGKVQQIVDAIRIERVASKDEILEQYLNRAMFAPGTQGIEAASERTFGVPSRELTLAQAAMMAGLAQAPVGHYPTRNMGRAMRRRQTVLDAMRATGVITEAEHAEASRDPLVVVDARPEPVALHFTDHVLALYPSPGTLQTTLSSPITLESQRRIAQYTALPSGSGVLRAAAVVLDGASCDVIAMVGSIESRGEFDRRTNWATTPMPSGLRTPHGATVLDSLLGALASAHSASPMPEAPPFGEELLAELHAAGLQTFTWEGSGPLGELLQDAEMTLLELATALSVLQRGGRTCTPRLLLTDPIDPGQQILSEQIADAARDALPELAAGVHLAQGVAVDGGWVGAWAVALDARHTVAVWVSGYDLAPLARDRIDAEPLLLAALPALALPSMR